MAIGVPEKGSMYQGPRLAVRLSVALLVIVTIVFAVAFVVSSTPKIDHVLLNSRAVLRGSGGRSPGKRICLRRRSPGRGF